MKGTKHLISCRCILPQFKRKPNPPVHQFVVFSILDDDDNIVGTKFVQCNNCRIIHKVTDICKSEILVNQEYMRSVTTKEEIKLSLPERLVAVLDSNQADLASYEAVQFILENKNWGEHVVLSSDEESGVRYIKYVRILSENLFKIKTHTEKLFL